MIRMIRMDLERKVGWRGLPPGLRATIRMAFSEGSTAQILYRVMRFFETHRLKPLSFLVYRLNAFFCHCIIGRGAEIGPGFCLLHSSGVVINTRVRAGANLILEHGVTIGAEKNQSPILGDNVYIGAGAKVIGPIQIGSDVKIGANAVVTKDLPDGATAVGVPARIVKIYGEKVGSSYLQEV